MKHSPLLRSTCFVHLVVALALPVATFSQETEDKANRSPWLAVPLLSSDPKVGTSLGGMLGYAHKFDAVSPASLFAFNAKYSNTESYTGGLFTKAYFGEDRHRLAGGIATGEIKNDYEDYLGSGLPVQVTDELKFAAIRYTYKVHGNWYLGAQYLRSNYQILADDPEIAADLETHGLTATDSAGLGLVLNYDSRDNQRSPTKGRTFLLTNVAYREDFGGDDDYDKYRLKYTQYTPHGAGHVLALRVGASMSEDAPEGAWASVDVRGYIRGNYLAPSSVSFEIEERHRFRERWSYAVFGGAACLWDGFSDCEEGDNWYPAAGAGIIFDLKPAEGFVVRFDVAVGKDDNSGIYLRFGQPF